MNRAPVLALVALVVAGLVACGTTQPPTGASDRPGGASPPPGASTEAPTVGPPDSFGPPPSPSPPDDTTGVVLDSTVLAVLPTSIGSVPVTEDADEAAALLNTTDLGDRASAADAAVAVDGTDLVVAWVVRLRDGFDAAAFQQWRDSYDEGACTAAGGVKGRAQAELGGRSTYVTSCVAALRTYHVWLEAQQMLVSASSVGDARFGEQLMSTLRVPE